MLKRLGFTVLAEGVETKEQLEWLKMADCDLVQGFYYAKPMSIVEFRKFLQEFNSGVGKSKAEAV
jgi:EAL domain-containing protein (putative c-di-GMP-specific phosphodiesterase class I)